MTAPRVPRNLGELRAALIDRCQLDPTDPHDTVAILNARINEAVAKLDMANPQGWPWDYQVLGSNPLIPSSTDPIVWELSSVVSRVRVVLLGDIDGLWQAPLERLTREKQLWRYPNDLARGVPQSYALGAADVAGPDEPTMAVWFRPLPAIDYSVTFEGYAPIPYLTGDAQPSAAFDHQIADWSDLALEYAAALTYRAHGDLSEAITASNVFDQGVMELRRWCRQTYGAGVTSHAELYS